MGSQPMKFRDFAESVLVWALLGRVSGLRGARLIQCALKGSIGKRILDVILRDLVKASERGYREREQQERLGQFREAIADAITQLYPPATNGMGILPSPSLGGQMVRANKDGKWLEVVPHPSVVLLIFVFSLISALFAGAVLRIVRASYISGSTRTLETTVVSPSAGSYFLK